MSGIAETTEAVPAPAIDPRWIQDTAFEISSTNCSKLQQIASAWREHPRRDPMHVVNKLRDTARALYAIADKIEGKRNACLQLERQP